VDLNSSGSGYYGGLVGHNYGEIRSSHSAGQFYSNYYYVGGLAGINDGKIINSSSSAIIQTQHYEVGGLVGINNGEINGCFFSGSVAGSSDYVGGIAAKNAGSGKVLNSYNKGTVTGSGAVGGLVGRVDAATVESSYSIGFISSNNSGSGGLIGSERNSPTVLNSFWDTETSGKTTSFGGTGKTTAQLKDINTYLDAGWDFETVWFMPENSYPMLRWEDYNYPSQIIFDNPEKIDPNGKYHIGVEENKTFVMQISVSDTEEDDIIFSIHSGLDADFFQIDANTGVIEFKNPPDYEAFEDNRSLNKYDLKIKISDGTNEVLQSFDVWITDVYEDTDGDGFRDSLEASAGSNLNDPASTPFNYGLVAWYPFDGNASDMSGNGNHGTVNGATLGTDRFGEENKAYSFDGDNDYISVSHNPNLNLTGEFSISLWINVESFDGVAGGQYHDFTWVALLSKGQWGSNGTWSLLFSTHPDEAKLGFYGEPEAYYSDLFSLNLNNWKKLTLIQNTESEMSHFIGDRRLGYPVENNGVSASLNSSDNLSIGFGNHSTHPYYFSGLIDDIRIYDRALSEDEIELLYRAESPNHFVDSAKDLEMIWVEPGTFTMGSPESEAGRINEAGRETAQCHPHKGILLGQV